MRSFTFTALCILGFIANSIAQSLVFEAEDATLSGGVKKQTYSGNSCAYMEGDGSITFSVNVQTEGVYKLIVSAATPFGEKTQDLYVNGVSSGQMKFESNTAWFDFNAGAIFLSLGDNTVEIRKNWGWMYVDKITLEQSVLNDYTKTDANLVNPNADEATKSTYAYLRSQYGTNIISGQTAYWNELVAIAEKIPMVRAFDFQTYTVGYSYLWDNSLGDHTFGWKDDGTTASAINWYKSTDKKGIVSFQWHWHSPFGGEAGTNTFYTNSTTFDVSQAVVSGTEEYYAVLQDVDSIASQLLKLQDAGVPVLWRPLHEAGGKWFWWGAKTADDCKALYNIVYDRLVNYHNISNVIWVWSTPEPDWYPGNDKVDIIGFDSYPGAYVYGSQKAVFNQLYDIVEGKKMVAMTENGPIPDIDKCIEEDAMWLYFSSWSDLVVQQNTEAHIKEVFAHTHVVTLGDEVSIKVSDVDDSQGFKVYPIPANNVLNIAFTETNVGQVQISIVNHEGKVVAEKQFATNGNMLIDISELAEGIYICKYNNGAKTGVVKFVKL